MTDLKNYRPSYVWPNPIIPFKLYFEHEDLRIFIIVNITHNWDWLSAYHNKFKDTDYFFVACGWYQSEVFAIQSETIFNLLNLNKKNFYFLFNEQSEMDHFTQRGFYGDIINQNAWIDENRMRYLPGTDKRHDALYIARFSAFKRHHLARKVNNLALVAGNNHGNTIPDDIPAAAYVNDHLFNSEEICHIINQSRCGLVLSSEEGACYASSEYLLCGVPVVSTESIGGRSVWYNEFNSIICEDDPDAIASAVQYFQDNKVSPQAIRDAHLAQAQEYRMKFVTVFAHLLAQHSIDDVNPESYFKEHFTHKMKEYIEPDFDALFP